MLSFPKAKRKTPRARGRFRCRKVLPRDFSALADMDIARKRNGKADESRMQIFPKAKRKGQGEGSAFRFRRFPAQREESGLPDFAFGAFPWTGVSQTDDLIRASECGKSALCMRAFWFRFRKAACRHGTARGQPMCGTRVARGQAFASG